MSEQNDQELEALFETEEAQENVPKALRDAYARQKAENEQLRQQIADKEKAERESTVKNFVKDKGLPDKAINLIGESDPEQWFTEYGELFAVETGIEEKVEESKVSPEQVEQIKQVANVQPGAYSPDSGEELASKLDEIYSADIPEAERHARLKSIGAM